MEKGENGSLRMDMVFRRCGKLRRMRFIRASEFLCYLHRVIHYIHTSIPTTDSTELYYWSVADDNVITLKTLASDLRTTLFQ
jgi:hypothetical protein